MHARDLSSQRVLPLTFTANGRRLCDRYTLLERLGGGVRTEVWRARDDADGTEVALKLLIPAFSRNEAAKAVLASEYEITSRLSHSAVLEVFPPQYDKVTLLLPMELASGGDAQRLRGAMYFEVLPVLLEIAEALAHAHERGVVHRDLKMSNVLFDGGGHVRLTGFSALAGVLPDTAQAAFRLPASSSGASPEALRGLSPSVTDDVYALGALAFELLTGRPACQPDGQANGRTGTEEATPAFTPVHRAPRRIGDLVTRMLAKSAQARPASMREVIDQLEAALSDTITLDFDEFMELPEESPPPPPTTQRPSTTQPEHGLAPRQRAQEPAPPAATSVSAPAPPPPVNALEVDTVAVRQNPYASRPSTKKPKRVLRQVLMPYLPTAAWLVLVVTALLGALYWLSPYLAQLATAVTQAEASVVQKPQQLTPSPATPAADERLRLERLKTARESFARRVAALEERFGQQAIASKLEPAKARAAESTGARDAGALDVAEERMNDALRMIGIVEAQMSSTASAPDASAVVARPGTASATPPNGTAVAARPATPSRRVEELYLNAINAGLTALGSGRLEEAQIAFELARSTLPEREEAGQGLERVRAALNARAAASARARAESLESQERWAEAEKEYEAALQLDPGLEIAREGLERAAVRLELSNSLQAFIDHPQRLSGRRPEARELVERARAAQPSGPRLRAQIVMLDRLLEQSATPVTLAGKHRLPNSESYYPAVSKRLGEEGTANVRVCVDAEGRIQGEPILVESSGSARIDAGALRLARAGRYAVSMRGGQPIPNCHDLRIVFALKD